MYPAVVMGFLPNNRKSIDFFPKQHMECFLNFCVLKIPLLIAVIGMVKVWYTDISVEKSFFPLSLILGYTAYSISVWY